MKVSVAVLSLFLVVACDNGGGSRRSKGAPKGRTTLATEPKQDTKAVETAEVKTEPVAKNYLLQVTVENTLKGEKVECDAKNKKLAVTSQDENVRQILCTNSKVSVSAVSNAGAVTFEARDLAKNQELGPGKNSKNPAEFDLEKTQGVLRYEAENPYGRTSVTAENITGVDEKLLTKRNDLVVQAQKLQEKIRHSGKGRVSQKTIEELEDLKREIADLDLEIDRTKKL